MAMHEAERIRDVPRFCSCDWEWSPALRRFMLVKFRPGCAWHGK